MKDDAGTSAEFERYFGLRAEAEKEIEEKEEPPGELEIRGEFPSWGCEREPSATETLPPERTLLEVGRSVLAAASAGPHAGPDAGPDAGTSA